ncbi:cyclic peptide export ABC transporter [Methylocapsa sp. S129]|uniref:cyclic peptide export ABC transporter n=1 Tax=Methylocapsa sp. S129 TaxID=1641869 RepID=UPI00131A8ED2|nr:cyclic peptide export ABC transporter [Methylocapsa sp. S129]
MSTEKSNHDFRILMSEAFRLLRPFWILTLFGTAVGALSGLATAWLLATINRGLHDPQGATWTLLAEFLGLCLLSVGGAAIAGALNSIIGQRLIAALRKDISARILRAPIAALEAFRSHRIMAVLTNDVDTVSAFTFNFSGYAIAFAVTVGSFIYLLTLSLVVFLLALVSLGLGVAINIIAKRGWIRDYEDVRVAQDDLHKQYRAIIDGAKELKINRARRARVHGVLLSAAADRIAALKSRAMRLFWVADAAGSAVFFAVIGLLLAWRHAFGIDAGVVSGAVIVLLYVKGPVERIAGALPILDQARVSFRRIAELSTELDQHEPNHAIALVTDAPPPPRTIRLIELQGATYAFPTRYGRSPFRLGPINLTIRAGEMLFIIGENGSGKTTLVKLLLGLYVPQDGAILFDGERLTPESRDDYRQLFSTVFSDYYLFDDLADSALSEDAQPYLERLGIAQRVKIEGDRFSTTDLSTGQRKRLALVHAYLERRPILVTDEWAADQDPEFRRIFYEELLPDLKAQGRTLIVISHDDRYFGAADRVVRLSEGKIIEDRHATVRS